MRIAFLGSRGIPACYSGFETFVEQVSVRLVRRGHTVTVYNRVPFNKYRETTYQGVRLVHVPTIPTKATDTIVHTTLSVLHSLRARYHVAYFCGVGNALLAGVPKCVDSKTVVNVDGADFERAKWSGFGRWWLHRSESWAAQHAHVVIADNGTIQRRYRQLYGVEARLIPYGANVVTADPGTNWLQKWNLKPGAYFLYVSRLTPENAADLTMKAHLRANTGLPLVVVGDAPYQKEYIAELKSLATRSDKIIMTGFLFGDAYRQLSYHSRAFVLPTAIDATRPVLLDQMGFGKCVIVRNTPGNLEVVDQCGIAFEHENPEATLATAMERIAANLELAEDLGRRAQQRVREHYDWDVVTRRYESLFEELCQAKQADAAAAAPKIP